jgi:hypothetical protein
LNGVQVNGSNEGDARFASGPAARWLPRVLAASVLTASMVLAMRYESAASLDFVKLLRAVIVTTGALVALWIIRSGGEVRLVVELGARHLRYGSREGSPVLNYSAIERLTFQTPFAGIWRWLPAVILQDEHQRSWRLPATLQNGAALIDQLVQLSGRSDLKSWAASLNLSRRMNRPGITVAAGYLLAASIFALSIFHYIN